MKYGVTRARKRVQSWAGAGLVEKGVAFASEQKGVGDGCGDRGHLLGSVPALGVCTRAASEVCSFFPTRFIGKRDS